MKETKLRKTVTAIRKSVVRNPAKKLFSVSKSKDGPTGDKTNTKKTLNFQKEKQEWPFSHKVRAVLLYDWNACLINLAEFPQ